MKIIYKKELKTNIRSEEIHCLPYDFWVSVFFPKENAKLEKKWKDTKSNVDGEAMNSLDSGRVVLRFKTLTHNTIAHEINHAVTMILDHVGHDFSGSFDEPMAYLTGYITEEVYKRAKKLGYKIK